MAGDFGVIILVTLIISFVSLEVDGQCTLPLSDGNWLSSTRGTWTVTGSGTQVENFKADLTASLSTATLNCTQTGTTSNQYILSTYFEIFTGLFITVYTCLDIQPAQAPYSYIGYFVTPTDTSTGEKFTSDLNTVCSNTDYDTPTNVMMILQSGSEANASVNCNDVILGNYTVTYTDSNAGVTTDIEMDSCNDTTKMNFYNVASGDNLAFTTGNTLQCVYSVSSGSNEYIYTYNSDASVNSVTTYTFACWVFSYITGGTSGTVYPKQCLSEQTSSSVAYPGQMFEFSPYFVCPLNTSADDTGLDGWVIALIVMAVLLVLVIVAVVVAYILMKRQRATDEEKGIVKDRQPSPDDIPDEDPALLENRDPKYKTFRTKEEGYDSGFDEKGQLREKMIREKSFELHELKKGKGKKLVPGKPFKKTTDPVTPRKTETETESEDKKKTTEPVTQRKTKTEPEDKKPSIPEGEPEVLPVPGTLPRPEEDALIKKIKKERERKEKEKEEKKKHQDTKKAKINDEKQEDGAEKEQPVIKTVREDSASDEYETDESEKEERRQRLLEKKRRLEAASYVPPDGIPDATVVGRKKAWHRGEDHDTDDKAKHLVSRDEKEKQDKNRKSRAKAMRSLAKRKFRPPSGQDASSDEDGDQVSKQNKRRKASSARNRGAPYMEQYHVKKDIEKELDDIDFWNERESYLQDAVNDMAFDDDHPKPLNVAPAETIDHSPRSTAATQVDTLAGKEKSDSTKQELIAQEEQSALDKPLPELEIEIGQNGQLPEGYYRDAKGNIVRESDGEIIATADVVKQIEMRKRMNVFGLPRLVRNTDGRPLGGYKDDIFGPTAEWDWGEITDEADDKKSEIVPRATSGKQVAFTTTDGTTAPPTPSREYDYNQLKGRQLGSAERELLQQRLFEQQRLKANTESGKRLPVFLKRNGNKPESVYIENSQVQSLDENKSKRSNSLRTAPPSGGSMMMRSDTFDDGRKDTRKQGLRRNTKLRASWSASDSFVRNGIPEETEMDNLESAPKATGKTRNLGSDDEFVCVGMGTKGTGQRFGYTPAREDTLMSDISMRTAPDSFRPFSGDGKRYRRWLGELYKDQKYFQYYLDTEHLPTKAAKETRGLASHGLDFLNERAEFWSEHEPPQRPYPSELALPLSRMQTLYTIADSGMDSAVSSELARPHSADDADNNIASVRLSKRESTREMTGRLAIPRQKSDLAQSSRREPPTGRSEPSVSPAKMEKNLSAERRESEQTKDVHSDSKDSPMKTKEGMKIKTATKGGKENVLTVHHLDQDI